MENYNFLQYFPPFFVEMLKEANMKQEDVREIRIRAGCPPIAVGDTLQVLDEQPWSAEMVRRTADRMCQNSVYARQGELRRGFVTLPGGHRAGICGRTVMENGEIKHLTDISAINLRIAHQILGAADPVMDYIVTNGDVQNTIIVSPPACGKTTLLRDIARQLGGGKYQFRVGIADERGEIAAMHHGVAQNDVGFLTDVYDGCPKAEGMRMLLRGMSPAVLITDEIGTKEDEAAIVEAVHAGVRVICSLHGFGKEDALFKDGIGRLLQNGILRRVITLRRIGEIASIT